MIYSVTVVGTYLVKNEKDLKKKKHTSKINYFFIVDVTIVMNFRTFFLYFFGSTSL